MKPVSKPMARMLADMLAMHTSYAEPFRPGYSYANCRGGISRHLVTLVGDCYTLMLRAKAVRTQQEWGRLMYFGLNLLEDMERRRWESARSHAVVQAAEAVLRSVGGGR